MAETDYQEALKVAEELANYREDALYDELGLRLLDVLNDGGYERSKQYSAEYAETAADMGFTDDLLNFGKIWLIKLWPKIKELLCEKQHPEMKELIKDKSIPEIAVALAINALIIPLAPPAWLIVITTILAKKIIESGLETFCEKGLQ